MTRWISGLIVLTACGGGNAGTVDAASERDTAIGPDALNDSMSILVLEDGVDVMGGLRFANVAAPLVAMVAVELPGGSVLVVTTGTDGRATVNGIDWSRGRASAVAYADTSHGYAGAIELAPETFALIPHEEDADVVLTLPRLGQFVPMGISISGNLSRATAGDDVFVSAIAGSSAEVATAATYQIGAPEDTTPTILAAELMGTGSRWATFTTPKLTTNLTLDLDLVHGGTTVTPERVTQHAVFDDSNPPAGEPIVRVFSATDEGHPALGLQLPQTAPPGDFTIEYVPVGGATPLVEVFGVSGSNARSRTFSVGAPVDGGTVTLLSGPDAPTGAFVASAIPVTGAAPTAVIGIEGAYSLGGPFSIQAPPGTTAVHVPLPPPATGEGGATVIQLTASNGYLSSVHLYAQTAASPLFSIVGH